MTEALPIVAPGLTVSEVMYCRGMLDGQPVLVAYNATLDTTSIVAPVSRRYRTVMRALETIEAGTVPLPLPRRTIISPGRIEAGRH